MNLPDLEVSVDNWEVIVETCRKQLDESDHPAISCFKQYSVCPAGVLTALSRELYQVAMACGGYSRIIKPSDYYDLPAIFVDAVDIINDELSMLRPRNG